MRVLFALALLAGAVAGAPSETAAVTCEDARSACQSACVAAGATSAQFFCQETDAGVLQQCACGPTPASALDSATALSSSAPSSLVDLLTAYFSSDARPTGDVRRAGPKDSDDYFTSDGGASSYQVVAVPLSWAQVSSYAATAARLSAAIASTREAIARSSDALFSSSSSSSEEPEWHRRHHHGPHSHHGEAAVSTESSQTVNDQEEPPCVGGALFGFFLIGASAYVAVRAVRTMARRSRERAALRNDSFFAVEGSEPMLVLRTAPAYSKA